MAGNRPLREMEARAKLLGMVETSALLLNAQLKTIEFALGAGCLLENTQREKDHFNKKKTCLQFAKGLGVVEFSPFFKNVFLHEKKCKDLFQFHFKNFLGSTI